MKNHKSINQIKTSNHWLDKPNPFSLDATRVLAYLFANFKKELDFPKKDANPLTINKPIKEIMVLFSVYGNDKNSKQRIKKCIENELTSIQSGYVWNKSIDDFKLIGPPATSATVSNAHISLNINPDLIDQILTSENFTISYLETITNLKTLNQINFFNMLNKHAFKGFVLISIEDIRRMLGITTNQYQRNSLLMQRIINPCIDAVNKHSHIRISLNPKKHTKLNKKITHLYFEITYQNQLQQLDQRIVDKDTKEAELKEKFQQIGISYDIALSLKKYSKTILIQAADKVIIQQQRKRVSNPKGYFFTVLEQISAENKVKNYQEYLAANYINNLIPKESNYVWEEFKRNTTPINKELLDGYKNANDSVKHALNKEINFEYRKWVYNNKIKQ